MTDITGSGVYRTTSLIAISYGLDSLQTLPSLLSLLPSPASTAVLVLTSKSLANSPYLKDIISLLGAQYVVRLSLSPPRLRAEPPARLTCLRDERCEVFLFRACFQTLLCAERLLNP